MRAVSVLRYMSEFMGIPGFRISATGFADTRPKATNETPEGRSLNRRVELVVLIGDDELDVVPKFADFSGGDGSDDEGSVVIDPETGEAQTGEPLPQPPIVDISPDVEPNLPGGSQ